LLALSFDDRHQAAELEPRELDVARTAQRSEAEVSQEVRREDRLVHLEPLVLRLALAVAIGERLERLRTAVPRIADRCKKQRLHHPGTRGLDQIGARDEHSIL